MGHSFDIHEAAETERAARLECRLLFHGIGEVERSSRTGPRDQEVEVRGPGPRAPEVAMKGHHLRSHETGVLQAYGSSMWQGLV